MNKLDILAQQLGRKGRKLIKRLRKPGPSLTPDADAAKVRYAGMSTPAQPAGMQAATHEHYRGELPSARKLKIAPVKLARKRSLQIKNRNNLSEAQLEEQRRLKREAYAAKKVAAPVLSAKATLAAKHAVIVAKGDQDKAEEVERLVAKRSKGIQSANNSPMDVTVTGPSGKLHGIEVKTLLTQTNDKLTMKRDAVDRKTDWGKKNKAKIHTLAVDLRGHKPVLYHREGVGAFRLAGMKKVDGGFSGLAALFA